MKKAILAILDGVGVREEEYGNAFKLADTPTLDFLLQTYPHCLLEASGSFVGLPDNQMGNSEVGHMTIGTGRIIEQPLTAINKAIINKTFFSNRAILDVIKHVKDNDSKLHILGLLSDGGVHSHINHILSLIDMAKQNDIHKLYIHVFLDGRDTLPQVALKYLDQLSAYLEEKHLGKIATISGRYYAMDREGMWDKTKMAYDVIVNNFGPYEENYTELIEKSYKNADYDEFVIPSIVNKAGVIEDNDGLILANFRPDRATQLFSAITNPSFDKFETKKLNNIKLVTMMPVDQSIICTNAYEHQDINNTLGEVVANSGYRVLRIAEVSKYPHITHFFDGDRDIDIVNTTKIKVGRKEVETYDLCPEMSSNEMTDVIEQKIDEFDFIVVNYANGDMVGHTGNLDAAIKAMETVDDCIKRLYELSLKNDFELIITADHGNLEEMLDKNGNSLTNHTTNKVNLILCNNDYALTDGSLKDIAPSILKMLNLIVPTEMSGNNIILEITELL